MTFPTLLSTALNGSSRRYMSASLYTALFRLGSKDATIWYSISCRKLRRLKVYEFVCECVGLLYQICTSENINWAYKRSRATYRKEKGPGLSPGGRFPPGFNYRVIITSGLKRWYDCMFSL